MRYRPLTIWVEKATRHEWWASIRPGDEPQGRIPLSDTGRGGATVRRAEGPGANRREAGSRYRLRPGTASLRHGSFGRARGPRMRYRYQRRHVDHVEKALRRATLDRIPESGCNEPSLSR